MVKEDRKKLVEMITSALFIYSLWAGFGIGLIVVMEGLIWVHNHLVHIPDFGAIFTMLVSVFMVLIMYTLVYFIYICFKLAFRED